MVSSLWSCGVPKTMLTYAVDIGFIRSMVSELVKLTACKGLKERFDSFHDQSNFFPYLAGDRRLRASEIPSSTTGRENRKMV